MRGWFRDRSAECGSDSLEGGVPSRFRTRAQPRTESLDLFVSSGARIVLSADIDVLDDLAVAFVSVIVVAEA